jgi:hypothetical protein
MDFSSVSEQQQFAFILTVESVKSVCECLEIDYKKILMTIKI